MIDQAETLRLQMMKIQGKLARSIAVVSGKGGVGKSNFSTNFAYALHSRGQKVLIIDMDIGMGNIHILLGKTPKNSLKDYLSGTTELKEVINKTEHGLDFISGGSGLDSVMEWSEETFNRLIKAFENLQQEYDFILFDMGAGATQQAIQLIISVDEVIVISTTEPTSITDAYSMMKFICLRDPDKLFHIVGNRIPKGDNGNDAILRLQLAMRKFLEKEVKVLGFLPEDEAVQKAVLSQQPFLELFPNSSVSKIMLSITSNFVEVDLSENHGKGEGFLERLKTIFRKGRD
ncbi:MinD/ParA family protein [Sporosarcina sp. CAU 1771]